MKRDSRTGCSEEQGFLYTGNDRFTRALNWLFGCPDVFSFEHRFLNAALFFGTGIAVLMNIVNYQIGFDRMFVLELGLYALGGVAALVMSRLLKMFQIARFCMVSITFPLTIHGWFVTGGLTSGFPPMMMFFGALVAMVYSGKSRLVALGLYLLLLPGLTFVELQHPHLLWGTSGRPLPDKSLIYVDVLISYMVFSYALIALIAVLIDAFKRENALVAERSVTLKKMAETDTLTGLFNRARISAILAEHVSLAKRYGQRLSVLMIDFDHFKEVNDTWGHAEGDRVLKTAAATIDANCRNTDSVGRFGGEEFLAVIPFTDQEGLDRMAMRLREDVSAQTIRPDGKPITISIGGAVWHQDMTAEELVHLADQRMYQAKAAGRDCAITK